jgi:hypothetical protein
LNKSIIRAVQAIDFRYELARFPNNLTGGEKVPRFASWRIEL